jgi:HEAT repeat protein
LPAVLADDPSTVSKLVVLARDGARSDDIRRQSVHWIGLVGDESVVPTLLSFVKSDRSSGANADDDGVGPGEEGLGNAAVAALSFIQDGGGVPALIDLARGGGPAARRSAVFWLGQTGDPRAMTALHTIIENQRESEAMRKRAIFALTHGNAPPAEFAYLRAIYPRLGSDELKESVFMGMAEDETGGTWLVDIARSPTESIELRKKALFWAGQRSATPTKALVDYYRSTSEPELREHAIFVLSQRDDDAAANELLRIAQDDKDREMRKKALFWLAQKDDPRVAKLISDRVSH